MKKILLILALLTPKLSYSYTVAQVPKNPGSWVDKQVLQNGSAFEQGFTELWKKSNLIPYSFYWNSDTDDGSKAYSKHLHDFFLGTEKKAFSQVTKHIELPLSNGAAYYAKLIRLIDENKNILEHLTPQDVLLASLFEKRFNEIRQQYLIKEVAEIVPLTLLAKFVDGFKLDLLYKKMGETSKFNRLLYREIGETSNFNHPLNKTIGTDFELLQNIPKKHLPIFDELLLHLIVYRAGTTTDDGFKSAAIKIELEKNILTMSKKVGIKWDINVIRKSRQPEVDFSEILIKAVPK